VRHQQRTHRAGAQVEQVQSRLGGSLGVVDDHDDAVGQPLILVPLVRGQRLLEQLRTDLGVRVEIDVTPCQGVRRRDYRQKREDATYKPPH
jgi:hypothetical protein